MQSNSILNYAALISVYIVPMALYSRDFHFDFTIHEDARNKET